MTRFSGASLTHLYSLVCWKGFDNRKRYSVIVLLSHIAFLLLASIFIQHNGMQLLFALISATTIFCTAKRRIADANQDKRWILLPSISFLLATLLVIGMNSSASFWLLVLSLVTSAVLLKFPETNNHSYMYGYNGPVDLTPPLNPQQTKRQRVEPSLHASSQVQEVLVVEAPERHQRTFQTHSNNTVDVTALFSLLHTRIRKTDKRITFSIVTVALFIVAWLIAISGNTAEEIETSVQETKETKVSKPDHRQLNNVIVMPDDFELATNAYSGLAINWQADEVPNGIHWSLTTALGDKSCQTISFNNGTSFRVLEVTVKHAENYMASFSPIDSADITKNLANRSRFTLCGYEFSLKGSQAVLGKSTFYSKWL